MYIQMNYETNHRWIQRIGWGLAYTVLALLTMMAIAAIICRFYRGGL